MEWKLEVAAIPVSDVDRAKEFYSQKLGLNVDVDRTPSRRATNCSAVAWR